MPKLLFFIFVLPLFCFSQNGPEIACNAIPDNGKVLVVWNSTIEQSGTDFCIEKSADGVNFSSLFCQGSGGYNIQSIDFSEVDYFPYPGTSFYRVKQADASGKVSFSPIVAVKSNPISGSPCFVSDTETIENDPETKKDILVVMLDAAGNEEYSKVRVTSQQNQLYAEDLEGRLHAGNYLVMASSCNKLYSRRLTIK